jgi:hypothetical protein
MPAEIFDTDARAVAERLSFPTPETLNIEGVTVPFSARANRFCRVGDGFPPIVGQMAQVIYDRFYIRPDIARGPYLFVGDRLLRSAFVEQLGSVVVNRWSWQPGWSKTEVRDDGSVELRRSGETAVVNGEDFEDDKGRRIASTSSTMQQGFFHVFGECDHGLSGDATVRIYFNVSRAAALPLTAAVSQAFNEAGIGFHYKIVDEPQSFGRADGAVLYFSAADLDRAVAPLGYVREQAGRWLKSPVPLFSRRLAPGIGFVADPGTGESFGMHRGRLVAEGLWAAQSTGRKLRTGTVVKHIASAFERNGVTPDRAHLNAADGRDFPGELALAPASLQEALA